MFSCKHKYGTVQKDGYQYCEKCGTAIVAPCKHNWERLETIEIINWGNKVGLCYVDNCTKCLEIRKQYVHSKQYERRFGE